MNVVVVVVVGVVGDPFSLLQLVPPIRIAVFAWDFDEATNTAFRSKQSSGRFSADFM